MNQQRQAERKSKLDLGMTTSQSTESVTENSIDSASAPTTTPQERAERVASTATNILAATLQLTDLKSGTSWLEIQHSNYGRDRQKPYYSTNITNRSTERMRIDKFGTYARKGNSLVLYSITGGWFGSQQFQEWYELGDSSWIEPGQVVTDPNNHSNIGVYWVYFGTTASGKQFVAGSVWNGKPWWQLW